MSSCAANCMRKFNRIFIFLDCINSYDCCHEAVEVDDSSESLSQVVDAVVAIEVDDTSSSTPSSSTVTVASYNTLTAPCCGYKVHQPQQTDLGL